MKEPLSMIKYFPELELVKDEALRQKVDEIWNDLWQESAFQRLEDLPVIPGMDYPHVRHNRSVLHHVMAAADNLEEFHGVKLDRDILICSVLLQDASKLVEFEPAPGGVHMSEKGRQFQHGFFGAAAAMKAGMPMEIVRNIITHTIDNPVYPPTVYSKIIFYADQIDMAGLKADTWQKKGVIFRDSPYE